ncbi:hypothetical protein QN224_04480 [Sinorhizobium sp. 8-89]|uniref:hypothetical protein n=1 Tax=Sinorhizobium sp. 7-81 TaxID=3049087 RepID=UPI0024C2D08F|nr:hypothetical protein [Sinorhizobium sp. 7-81]MDK1384662.1 hypothetical protein [Sinorhizobium sp. 7-81]
MSGRVVFASGACAGLATVLVLMASANRRGRSHWRPINATSHWVHGRAAGSVSRFDLSHTLTGFVTHMLASFWWALPFSALLGSNTASAPRVVAAAAGTTVLAALVDYGLVPRRLTPGWELALPKTDIAKAYVAMALGLALGTFLHHDARMR